MLGIALFGCKKSFANIISCSFQHGTGGHFSSYVDVLQGGAWVSRHPNVGSFNHAIASAVVEALSDNLMAIGQKSSYSAFYLH